MTLPLITATICESEYISILSAYPAYKQSDRHIIIGSVENRSAVKIDVRSLTDV